MYLWAHVSGKNVFAAHVLAVHILAGCRYPSPSARWANLYYLYFPWKLEWTAFGTNNVVDLGLTTPAELWANKLPIALSDNCQNWGWYHILNYRKPELPCSFVSVLFSVLWPNLWRWCINNTNYQFISMWTRFWLLSECYWNLLWREHSSGCSSTSHSIF